MLASHVNRGKKVAISGAVGIYGHTTEVGHSNLASHDSNEKNAAIPGKFGVFAQTTEVNNAHANIQGGQGIIRHDISGNGANAISPIGRIIATFEPGTSSSTAYLSYSVEINNNSTPGDKTASSPYTRGIARLGCDVHKMHPFHTLTRSNFNRAIVRSLGWENPRITQSQLIAKLAGIGWEIVPNQDGCVIFTDPPSVVAFWYVLEDTTLENGCLCVAPGSHLTEPLRQRLVRDANRQPQLEDLERPVWAREALGKMQGGGEGGEGKGRGYEYKPLEVKKGTLVLFHGNLLHKSGVNRSERNRMAYNFNVVEGGAGGEDGEYLMPEGGRWERL
ncbi:MAG: hypothetical protein Q9170_004236 [Blastenia crenularia]